MSIVVQLSANRATLAKVLELNGNRCPFTEGTCLSGQHDQPRKFFMNLLIVEDEVRMLDLLRKGLTEEGHTVACAGDGGGEISEQGGDAD